ncbi:MAG: type II toxin-antitoxin system RelE/ParE family toxin [Alphaproteobacteria bacterium]
MIPVVVTDEYADWINDLRDRAGAQRITARILRLQLGNPGDVGPVGEGVSELRLMFGPGYRVYYATRGDELIILLAGGDKSSQARDIETAKELWRAWKDEQDEQG